MINYIVLAFTIFMGDALAFWDSAENRDMTIEESNVKIDLKENYAFSVETSTTIKPLSRKEVEYYNILSESFEPEIEDFRFIEIKHCSSLKNCRELNLDQIQESDEASDNGLKVFRVVKVPVEKLNIGDTLTYKTLREFKQPPNKDTFSYWKKFGNGDYEQNSTVDIKSEIPLHVKTNKESYFTSEKSKNHIRIKQKKDAYFVHKGGDFDNLFWPTEKAYPYVKISSESDWKTLADKFSGIFSSNRSSEIATIANRFKKFESSEEKIRQVSFWG